MKKNKTHTGFAITGTIIAAAGILALLGTGLFVMNKNNNQKNNFTNRNERQMVNTNKTNSPSANQSLVSTHPKEDLSELEIEGLVWMREEEKLARDVYRTLYKRT